MALRRAASGHRFSTNIWPGFVDALATLLMVLVFVLTIFTVMQSVLREQITDKDDTIASQGEVISAQEQRLERLGQQVAALGQALTVSEDREAGLQDRLAEAQAEARDRAARITRLSSQLETSRGELAQARSRLTDFEAEVAALMAARAADQEQAQARQEQAQARLTEQQSRTSAAELAVAAARQEIDAQAEQARLAAARRDALEALVADLRKSNQAAETLVADLRESDRATEERAGELQTKLTEAEAARLTDAEAARALRERLESADAELTAMTLALEESRRKAEETLTLLAGAEAARDRATQQATRSLTEAERQAALLATAEKALADQQNLSQDSQRRVALLNEQVASLTAQLGSLQALLDTAGEDQRQAELRVENLGQQLNAALLRAAEEKDRRLTLEEEARLRAEEEARDLARYRSEFFGRLSEILSGREGVQVVGDRFVFQSEVLFPPGATTLSPEGHDQIARVAKLLSEVADDIPPEIDWIIRVDGHTDNTQLSGTGRYRDNWELSQARALAVVRYMTDELGFPANRLAATGFADTRPVSQGQSADELAANRRIELKLTER
ncbi:peptidoglycan -binding protein [Paracoccus fontiphilus]|uniref:Peptidoglycan -binding protein n=2 Tax=Paracoccus TaxID=265 RepID=A0ABV7IKC1_9RHOB|nr:peptidoglycan -binding protein [Paracoccus fontiphilus]